MRVSREQALEWLSTAAEGVKSVQDIARLAEEAENKSGWRAAMSKASSWAGRRRERFNDDVSVTYNELQEFIKAIGAQAFEDVAINVWVALVGSRKRALSGKRPTPLIRVTVRQIRQLAKAGLPHPMENDLLKAWEINL